MFVVSGVTLCVFLCMYVHCCVVLCSGMFAESLPSFLDAKRGFGALLVKKGIFPQALAPNQYLVNEYQASLSLLLTSCSLSQYVRVLF